MKMLLVLWVCLSLAGTTRAQVAEKAADQIAIRDLHVGDSVPEVYLNDMINYAYTKARLSNFKGKLVILDMWSTNCTSCIEGFPKMERLQEEFKDKLQVLLVTYQSLPEVRVFLKRWKKYTGRSTSLPMLCGDTVLHAYFKHSGVPHCVWIDDTGVVESITDSGPVTAGNIKAMIDHQGVAMSQKMDSTLSMKYYEPLFIKGNGGDGEGLQYHSVLSKANPLFLQMSGVFSPDSSHSVILSYNTSVKFLYQVAYNDYLNELMFPENRVFVDITDTSTFVWYKDGETQWQNLYIYQLYTPRKSFGEMHRLMQEDLHRYFGYDAKIEKRKMKCWVLTSDDTTLLKSAGTGFNSEYDGLNFKLVYQNLPFSLFEERISYNLLYNSPYPFINDVNYSGDVDFVLDDVVENDPPRLIKALKKYKMHLTLEDRLIDVLVIKDPAPKAAEEIPRKFYGISLEDTIRKHLFGK